MKKIIAVGDSNFTLGFRLLGADEQAVESDPKAAFEAAMSEEYGIIITNEDAVSRLSPDFRRKVEASISPVVVVVDKSESLRAEIVRALGIDLWQQ